MEMTVLSLLLAYFFTVSTTVAPIVPQAAAFGSVRADSISLSDAEVYEASQVALAGGRFAWITGARQRLAIADLQSGIAKPMSSLGSGPGDMRVASRVFGCQDSAGWIDADLLRATWYNPDGSGSPTVTSLPAATLVRGRVVDAWCKADTLWYSLERQGRTQTPLTVDSLLIFRVTKDGSRLDTIGRLVGTNRIERSRGALRSNIRVPYTQPPAMVPGSTGPLLIWRSADSLTVVAGSSIARTTPLSSKGVALTRNHASVLRDSIRKATDDEMEALHYAPDLRREFRRVVDDIIGDISFPSFIPQIRAAAFIPGKADQAVVVLNSVPGSREVCISILASAALGPRQCYLPRHRSFGTIVHTGTDIWVTEWNEDDAWIRRLGPAVSP